MNANKHIICPVCKKEMTLYSNFGVTTLEGKLCAFVVAGYCDCNKVVQVKIPLDLSKAYI